MLSKLYPVRNINKIGLFFIIILFFGVFRQCQQRKTAHLNADVDIDALKETPLDHYVYDPDPNYHYDVAYQGKGEGYTFYVLRMVSQHWLTEAEVDDPEWWHWLKIVVPDSAGQDTGLLWIGGGAKDDELPETPGDILVTSALTTHTVTAEVHNIPNQPLTFKGDPYGERYEDELIAYGWRKFLEGGASEEDVIWLARLPMTKAVVRAMDAVSAFVFAEEGINLDHYVVAGGSKRGWTTWTTAAVDDRVIAIAPLVIDLLNVVPSFDHHWRNYGFWAPAVGNYVDEGIMEWMHSPEFARLLEITEPYSYIERFDMPKLLINATGDQFFQPDSWKFYWDDLAGEKLLRYVPNTGHSLEGSDAIETLVAFYQHVIDKEALPDYDWQINGSEVFVEIDPSDPPDDIKLWQAVSNEKARDFRIDVIGAAWSDSILTINPSGKYNITLPPPNDGWKAYFLELTYEKSGRLPLKITSGVQVIPEIYPFEPFVGTSD